ncbi:MAG TPA: sigma-70 family RNA polymerase sigma factor [Polyangiales bacterium]|nr:sigma-70 family RNA polymerase sigma factor [Polyangiales bacterium]
MRETSLHQRFPATRWSAIRASAEADAVTREQGFSRVIAAYWRPIYVYLRLRHRRSDADAHDLTQGFFADCWERNTFASFDPARARFRTFVRTCLDRFAVDEHRSAHAQKRGGERKHVPIDLAQLESDTALTDPALSSDPERLFEAEWVRSLLQQALTELRTSYASQSRDLDLALFEAYELGASERPSYAQLADRHGVPVTTVTNRLAAVRRALRACLAKNLREITSTEEEYREESFRVFGVRPE